jgi:cytochrome c553
MNLCRVLAVLAAFALTQQAWAAEGASATQKKAMCEGCHGIPDYRTAFPDVYNVPKLGGQSAAYLAKALKDYKSGARKHPTMIGIASSLSDQDIEMLAGYYAGSEAKK